MKKEFIELLKIDFNLKYLNELKNDVFYKAFQIKEVKERESIFFQEINSLSEFELKKFANPYYVGFGNPNSNILIVGKEKAFSTKNTDLLIKESINNFSHWKTLIQYDFLKVNHIDIKEKLGFNPLMPITYHTGLIKRNHTWGIINIILKHLHDGLDEEETSNYQNSFFNKCFITELNHIPAKYNEGSGLSIQREQFLSESFYKTFPKVIFSAKSYIKGRENIINQLFNAQLIETKSIGFIGQKRLRELYIDIYKSSKQEIFVCNQLSGASGWSDESLENFASLIKKTN